MSISYKLNQNDLNSVETFVNRVPLELRRDYDNLQNKAEFNVILAEYLEIFKDGIINAGKKKYFFSQDFPLVLKICVSKFIKFPDNQKGAVGSVMEEYYGSYGDPNILNNPYIVANVNELRI